jgi:hypothetical protein
VNDSAHVSDSAVATLEAPAAGTEGSEA